jgi:hypothetical protein
MCQFEPSGSVCRPAGGVCDVAETCSGTSADCPPVDLKDSTTVCRLSFGVCDPAEVCDGIADNCPADLKDSTTVCGPSGGVCDPEEVCDGSNDDCPADVFLPDGTGCDDGDACTAPDLCSSGVCNNAPLPDGDTDGFCDLVDNCPATFNPLQTNSDAFFAGDDCQCGDVSGNDVIDAADLEIARKHLVGATIDVPFDLTRCNVIGPPNQGIDDCDVRDIYILSRLLEGKAATIENTCLPFAGP